MNSLIERLEEWTDFDCAMHELALSIGLVKEADGSFAKEFKWIYWSANKFSDALSDMLLKMVELGLLEYDEYDQKFRAKKDFCLEHN